MPVTDAGGVVLPAWPRFMEPRPLPEATPETDARTAWVAERGNNKLCRSQLSRGKLWYGDVAQSLAKGRAK